MNLSEAVREYIDTWRALDALETSCDPDEVTYMDIVQARHYAAFDRMCELTKEGVEDE